MLVFIGKLLPSTKYQCARVTVVFSFSASFSIGDISHKQHKAKKRILFVSCNGLKNRVGRSVKPFFLHYFFGQKCVFNACFMLIGS